METQSIRYCPSCKALRQFEFVKTLGHSACTECYYHGEGVLNVQTYARKIVQGKILSTDNKGECQNCKSLTKKLHEQKNQLTGLIKKVSEQKKHITGLLKKEKK